MKSLVSVIIPTYNRTKYLEETILTVLEQTYNPIELIVVDDGSENNFAEKICQKHKIKYLQIPNSGGPAKPRNVGFKASKGSYIAWLDDDDLWFPTKIEEQVKFLNKNKNRDWVHCFNTYIDENGIEIKRNESTLFNAEEREGDIFISSIQKVLIKSPTVLLRRNFVEKVGMFNEKLKGSEDWEYWVRAAWYAPVGLIKKDLAMYRKGNDDKLSSNKLAYIHLVFELNKFLKSIKVDTEKDRTRLNLGRIELKKLAKKRLNRYSLQNISWLQFLKLVKIAYA